MDRQFQKHFKSVGEVVNELLAWDINPRDLGILMIKNMDAKKAISAMLAKEDMGTVKEQKQEKVPDIADFERLLNARDVAELLRVEEATVRGWVHRRIIPCVKISATCVRFRPRDIKAFVAKRLCPDDPEAVARRPKQTVPPRIGKPRKNSPVTRLQRS
jgi:predicted DNA-binding transcriptional regulator AlpA